MFVHELITYFERWAPPGASWNKDNVGLQVGSNEKKIKNIFLCLELNDAALNQAINKNCNFIFTHHPLIFTPIKKINFTSDTKAQLLKRIIKNDITVYSAHTNLDFTKDGVSFELAKRLGLNNIKFLKHEEQNQSKLVVFIPRKNVDSVAGAIFCAGGGVIGEYTNCSYRTEGKGTFIGSGSTKPAIGKKEILENVDEIRLEILVNNWNLKPVISAMIKKHPYEEPAYDIYPLENNNVNFGFGAIGELNKSLTESEFLEYVCSSLKIENLRYTKGKKGKINKVAVCGGSCSDLLFEAIFQEAGAFITADIKYHTFQDAEGKILFIDAGHYETEVPVLNVVKKRIDDFIAEKKNRCKVYKYNRSTNPVRFFNKKGVQ